MFVNFQIWNVWNSKILLFKILTLIPKNFKFEKLANFSICYIDEFGKWSNVRNCSTWKIVEFSNFNDLQKFFFFLRFGKSIFYDLMKLLNILVVQKIYKKMKKVKSIMKLSNNSSFVILIFAILKFRNIDRFVFRRLKLWPSPCETSYI